VNQNSANIINKIINNRTSDIASCGTFQLTEWIYDPPKILMKEMELCHLKQIRIQLIELVTTFPILKSES